VDRFDDRVNTFWGEVENSYKYILEKGSYYLNWRYCAPENKDLIVKLAIEDDAILGYIVMRLRTDDTEVVGSVIDFISLFDRDDVADAMIKDALVFFEDSGANSVYCPVTRGHRHQGILRNNGFINGSMARSNYLYYKFLSDKIQGNVFKDMKPDEVKLNYY
jgi:RimJ/RimL family protein N-acetyltransferase